MDPPWRFVEPDPDRIPIRRLAKRSTGRKYATSRWIADASIYLLALRTGITSVVSVDRKDFAVYRLPERNRLPTLRWDGRFWPG